jgi:hypothetical protein
MNTQKMPAVNMMQLVGAVERPTPGGEKPTKTWWTRIGVAFQNRDESWTLRFDYLPTRLHETTIQMRPISPKDAKDEQATE